MQDRAYHVPFPARKPRGVITVTGYGVYIKTWLRSLWVEDGFRSEGEARQRALHRATAPVERILLLAGSGTITVDALDWAAANGAPIVACDQAGGLRFTVLPGPGGQWRATLRRAQALALFSPVGVGIARWLVEEKVRRQHAVLQTLAPYTQRAQEAAAVLRRARRFASAESIERLRLLESQSAETYWSGWVGLAPQFAPPSYARTVLQHWRVFTSRHSPLSGGAKDAVDPVNALLNFGYSLLAAETLIACHGAGLDPALGILHADRDARLSFVYDLMEPARPAVDRCVLDLVTGRPFRRGDLWGLRDGTCRLDQEFAADLCGKWIALLRREVTPVVEKVASWLRRARIIQRDHPAHKAGRLPGDARTPALRGTCPECGSPVRAGRHFCSQACYAVWWKAHVQPRISREGNEALARLRKEGRDPSHGGEAARKRAAATSRIKRLEWMTLNPEERRRRTASATQVRWADRGGDAVRRR